MPENELTKNHNRLGQKESEKKKKKLSRSLLSSFSFYCPTDPLTIFESQDPKISKIYELQEHCATEFEAPKLRKCRSGASLFFLPLAFSLYLDPLVLTKQNRENKKRRRRKKRDLNLA